MIIAMNWFYEYTGPKNGEPPDYYEEVWYETNFREGSGIYGEPYPSSYYDETSEDTLRSDDKLPTEFKHVKKEYEEMQGKGWGIGASVTLSYNWEQYSADVSLGGEFTLMHYESSEAVYDFWLYGKHRVDVYEWNINGGWVLTYNLTHAPLTVRTYELEEGEKTDVNVWINSTQYSSPVENLVVACRDHTVEVESPFYQNGHRYAFQYWEDSNTSNPRTFNIANDTTLKAYYIREPVCAMKTNTSGYFYIPNIATDLLKIEMLFDNQNITGDQTSGTSPYSSIGNYPNGLVDIRDISFIARKFGSEEGDSDWNYMADIVPDKQIDIRDISAANRNFGKDGTYITDLSEVTITFNTSEEISPDDYGFVTIPQDATSFTVERYGTPIGAMITFW